VDSRTGKYEKLKPAFLLFTPRLVSDEETKKLWMQDSRYGFL